MADDSDWRDRLAGHRMAVDREFDERVRESALSNGQWGLVMTAVSFEVDGDDPDTAELVADTADLEHVLPEMQRRDGGRGFPGGGAGPDAGGPAPDAAAGGDASGGRGADDGSGGGFLDRVMESIGIGGDGGDGEAALEAEAERLAAAYADRLQTRLETAGAWEDVVRAASTSPSAPE
ncbi:MAG: DUF5799 family protein [Halobacteriaceae archaeon]